MIIMKLFWYIHIRSVDWLLKIQSVLQKFVPQLPCRQTYRYVDPFLGLTKKWHVIQRANGGINKDLMQMDRSTRISYNAVFNFDQLLQKLKNINRAKTLISKSCEQRNEEWSQEKKVEILGPISPRVTIHRQIIDTAIICKVTIMSMCCLNNPLIRSLIIPKKSKKKRSPVATNVQKKREDQKTKMPNTMFD